MGDVAGVLELIYLFFIFFLSGFIEQSYNLKLMGNVYLARINDQSMMASKSVEHHTVQDGIQSMVFCHSDKEDKKILKDYT